MKKIKLSLNLKKIYTGMIKQQLNVTELAKKTGVTQQAISSILHGRYNGSLKTVGIICKVLELPVEEVVILEEESPLS